MSTQNSPKSVETYLYFEGCCEEAMEFYRRTLGAEILFMSRFKDSPPDVQAAMCKPGMENKIMHVTCKIGATSLMASDGHCMGKPGFQGFSLTLAAQNEAEADSWFNALSEGGQVRMPMAQTFFAKRFGMVADRFGVAWMVMVPA